MELLGVIVQGKFFTGIELARGYFRGKGDFSVDVGPDFLAVFIKRSEKKSTGSKEQHYSLKRTEIITYMKGIVPSSTPRSLR
jgi:hypothetical protein